MAELVLDHIFKVYDNKITAVSDFNLHIKDKEFIVFVGPSGCGKSTTLRMIAGLEDISDGSFYIDGDRMNDVAPKDRNIAMVFQNYALYPHMTVYDNMAFGLKLRKLPKDEINRRVTEAAKILGLEDYLQRKPKALSGGQRQRVWIAMALVQDTDILILDEPTTYLDPAHQLEILNVLKRINQEHQKTIVMTIHDINLASRFSDRVIAMKERKIINEATPQEVITVTGLADVFAIQAEISYHSQTQLPLVLS